MASDQDLPAGFTPLDTGSRFVEHVGPLYLNDAGTAMGGFLATLVDVSFGHAIRTRADGDAAVATVSLTTDYLRPAKPGAWLESRVEIDRLGGRLAFGDCSVSADGEEVVRA